jgi:hypothetical protein
MKGPEGPRGFELLEDPKAKVDEAEEPITFSTFVLSLSTSALLHLGERPDEAMGIPLEEAGELNLPACQQTIDILEMLRSKTRGNLDPEESQLLDRVLHELHMRFVEVRRSRG